MAPFFVVLPEMVFFIISILISSVVLNVGLKIWLYAGWRKALCQKDNSSFQPHFSVIIAARNEAHNLKRYLPTILEQSYSNYEVIISLNHCEDDSVEVVKEFAALYPHLRFLEIAETPQDWAPKKWAIKQGILQSTYDHLVFTDADCEVKPTWLAEMAHVWDSETKLVLGLGRYIAYPSLLNRFIRYETTFTAFQYIGMGAHGHPYMGVGRNMAYAKSLYQEVGGFESFKSSLSGDDDLFVNAFGRGKKTKLLLTAESHTFSEPERRFGSWVRQKVRHVSASVKYSLRSKIFLASFHLSQIALYAALGGLLIFGGYFALAFLLYVVYMSIAWYIFSKISIAVREPALVAWYPILDMLYVVYNLSMVPMGLTLKPEWKKKIKNQKSPKTPSMTAN